ncbi:MAG: diguanylate cyclase [Magnetococcales bacterium]|nr:diguanylate cyclase [Magnetococcales bacterium]
MNAHLPDPEEVRELLFVLEKALSDHNTWMMNWHRAIICNQSVEEAHLDHKAHRKCNFGIWYYNSNHPILSNHQSFLNIRTIHRTLHEMGRELLIKSGKGLEIMPGEYDTFLEIRTQFRAEIRVLEKTLNDLIASTDPLTRVFNRSQMKSMIEHHHTMLKETGHVCSIAMVDLDHFKSINDTYGHKTGDDVLQFASGFIARNLRPSDLIFRYGGEEFLVCLPKTTTQTAFHVLERIRCQLSQQTINSTDDQVLKVTCSVGISQLQTNLSLEEAQKQADTAVYDAKQSGRNRICVFEEN